MSEPTVTYTCEEHDYAEVTYPDSFQVRVFLSDVTR